MKEKSVHGWLCILNRENFDVLKKERVYGVPRNVRALNQIKKVRIGDILVFYAISPEKRIMGISKALSSMFEENTMAPWTDRLYPYRIKIDEVEEIVVRSKRFVGKIRARAFHYCWMHAHDVHFSL